MLLEHVGISPAIIVSESFSIARTAQVSVHAKIANSAAYFFRLLIV